MSTYHNLIIYQEMMAVQVSKVIEDAFGLLKLCIVNQDFTMVDGSLP